MIRAVLITLLTIGVAGTAYWGYQEHQEKNAILINAENNYQRAFHELTYEMDLLHDNIGTTLAMNSRKSLSPALADVWRLTSEAHSDVGQLPLTLMPFNKTEEFLANIGEFSYRVAVRDLDKEPLNDKEYSTLKELYKQSADIQDELRNVQHLVLKNNLRWMDVEMALASGKEQTDNTIIDGFKTVDKAAEGYTEASFGGTSFVNTRKDQNEYSQIKGKEISKQEAIQIAKKFSQIKNPKEVKVTESGKGADYNFYSVTISNGKTQANLDLTKKGGYPMMYIHHREIAKKQLGLNSAAQKGAQFLQNHNFKNMELYESAQYDNIGVFSFVNVENNIRIYPDSIMLKVALDTGEVIGFAAEDYYKNHKERNLNAPVIKEAEAKTKLNPKFKVMEKRQSVIINDLKEEVLCYEFLGMLGKDSYRIFINAENGIEEKVEKLKSAEPIYQDML